MAVNYGGKLVCNRQIRVQNNPVYTPIINFITNIKVAMARP